MRDIAYGDEELMESVLAATSRIAEVERILDTRKSDAHAASIRAYAELTDRIGESNEASD